jgi:N-glycosylase/DNA lyase
MDIAMAGTEIWWRKKYKHYLNTKRLEKSTADVERKIRSNAGRKRGKYYDFKIIQRAQLTIHSLAATSVCRMASTASFRVMPLPSSSW